MRGRDRPTNDGPANQPSGNAEPQSQAARMGRPGRGRSRDYQR